MASTSDTPNERAARRAQQVKDRREQNARGRNDERQKRYVQNKRELTIIKVVAGLIAVGIVAAIGISVWNWGQDRELNRQPEGVRTYTYAGNQHRNEPINYSVEPDYQGEIPPAGGTHNPAWQNCGVYDAPIPWEYAVHSLEHGAIWISYSPDLAAEEIERLREYGDDDKMLVAPENNLPAPIVLTSWRNQMTAQSADTENVKRFIRFYKNNPDFAPEAGASCSSTNNTTRP